jgi:hypothetical protein
MIAAKRKNAEPAEEIKIAIIIAIVQILALPALKADIVTDGLEDRTSCSFRYRVCRALRWN